MDVERLPDHQRPVLLLPGRDILRDRSRYLQDLHPLLLPSRLSGKELSSPYVQRDGCMCAIHGRFLRRNPHPMSTYQFGLDPVGWTTRGHMQRHSSSRLDRGCYQHLLGCCSDGAPNETSGRAKHESEEEAHGHGHVRCWYLRHCGLGHPSGVAHSLLEHAKRHLGLRGRWFMESYRDRCFDHLRMHAGSSDVDCQVLAKDNIDIRVKQEHLD